MADQAPSRRRAWPTRELAIALAVGLVVTFFVIWRDARREDITFTIGATPAETLQTAIELTGVPRRSFALPRLPRAERGEVILHIATYFQRPTATVRLEVVDGRGRAQSACAFPPETYYDNARIRCAVPSLADARRIVVTHAGPAKLAIFGNEARPGKPAVVGVLAFRNARDLIGRMRTAVDRVGVSLPPGVGPVVLIAGLWTSISAVVLALLLAVGIARERTEPLPVQRADERAGGEDEGEPGKGVDVPPRTT